MKFASWIGPAAVLLALSASPLSAGQVGVELVKDIDTGLVAASSDPQRFRTIDGKVYFAATTPETGQELFVSEGSAAPPRLVADIARGAGSSSPTALGMAGGRLIVAGDDGYRGEQFWSVDAAGATTRLSSVNMQTFGPRASPLGNAGNRLVFQGRDRTLWSSDGSTAGTQRLGNLRGSQDGWPACSIGGRVVMLIEQGSSTFLTATDGTMANTASLANLGDIEGAYAASDGSYCYFALNGYPHWRIWRSDGTAAGTALWREASGNSSLCGMAVLGSRFYVLEQGNGFRLVDADTQTVQLSLPQTGCGFPRSMEVVAGRLAFFAPLPSDSNNNWNQALYVSDGTAAGTRSVPRPADLFSWESTRLAVMGNRIVYAAYSRGPYTVDPVTATQEALPARLHGLLQADLAALNGAVLLSGNDEAHGYEVWRSDGSVAGTALLHDLWAPTADGVGWTDPVRQGTAVGDTFFFVRQGRASEGGSTDLWRSDGSAAGTTALPYSSYNGDSVDAVIPLGDGVLFSTSRYGSPPRMSVYRADAALTTASLVWTDNTVASVLQAIPGGGALYDCDGTGSGNLCALAPGVAEPAIVAPALQLGGIEPLGVFGGVTLFLASAGNTRGLWRSDGTAPGTFRIAADLYLPFQGSSRPPAATAHNGRFWFHACHGSDDNCALYTSDGSSGGTLRVASLAPTVIDIQPVGSRVAVLVDSGGAQLWVSDGSAAGTYALGSFTGSFASAMASTGGQVHFFASANSTNSYYVSDGTVAGTRAVALPPTFSPQLQQGPVALDADTLVFRCTSPATGEELCVNDVQASQVSLLRDVFPGPSSSTPQFMGKAGTAAYFAIDDGRHGRELWRVHLLADAIFDNGFE